MPQLIQGHVRFTADDFQLQDFTTSATEHYKTHTSRQLNDLLQMEATHLANMKDPDIVQQFDTSQNVQKSLTRALALITAMAEREGYDLHI